MTSIAICHETTKELFSKNYYDEKMSENIISNYIHMFNIFKSNSKNEVIIKPERLKELIDSSNSQRKEGLSNFINYIIFALKQKKVIANVFNYRFIDKVVLDEIGRKIGYSSAQSNRFIKTACQNYFYETSLFEDKGCVFSNYLKKYYDFTGDDKTKTEKVIELIKVYDRLLLIIPTVKKIRDCLVNELETINIYCRQSNIEHRILFKSSIKQIKSYLKKLNAFLSDCKIICQINGLMSKFIANNEILRFLYVDGKSKKDLATILKCSVKKVDKQIQETLNVTVKKTEYIIKLLLE